jgi:hypothetical protein
LLFGNNTDVRNYAQEIVKQHNNDFIFRDYYIDNILSHPSSAIYILGEKGIPGDAEDIIFRYINDNSIRVVK